MTDCLALDLAQLSPRLRQLIAGKAREWDCSHETAAIRLLDEAAASTTRQQAEPPETDANARQLQSPGLHQAHTLTQTP